MFRRGRGKLIISIEAGNDTHTRRARVHARTRTHTRTLARTTHAHTYDTYTKIQNFARLYHSSLFFILSS